MKEKNFKVMLKRSIAGHEVAEITIKAKSQNQAKGVAEYFAKVGHPNIDFKWDGKIEKRGQIVSLAEEIE